MLGAVRNRIAGGAFRGVFAAVFALALTLRILVPAGFMPVETARGLTVRICDGMGDSRTVVIDLQRSEDGKQRPQHQEQPTACAFAALSSPAMVSDAVPTIALAAMVLGEYALPPPFPFVLSSPDYLVPPLRGPPSLA